MLRLSDRRVGVALGYHSIGDPEGDPDRELVPKLASARFEAQLRHLKRHYRPVRASSCARRSPPDGEAGAFPVAVTFDDDLASHAEVAIPILRRTGVPATFFVCGASLEQPFSFWWNDCNGLRTAARWLVAPSTRRGVDSGRHHRSTRVREARDCWSSADPIHRMPGFAPPVFVSCSRPGWSSASTPGSTTT
jgi:hypothetical protein